MNIRKCADINEMGKKAGSMVITELKHNPKLLVCPATGSSPVSLYASLANEASKNMTLFQEMRVIPLDEWVGLPDATGSCDSFIKEHITTPLHVSKDRYFPFNTAAENLKEECERMQYILKKQGPIDLCILGLGQNGHLGFNEPANKTTPYCHIAQLATSSQQHDMVANSQTKPTMGLTLGMQDILLSKRIILLISGKGKKEAKEKLFSKEISPKCPASFLWNHKSVECFLVDD